MNNNKKIGIVGGVGPYAGLDLAKKILIETNANKDQEYLPTLSISTPHQIEDRTSFLLGESSINPAEGVLENLLDLAKIGATVAGIPCNTLHAPKIWDTLTARFQDSNSDLKLLDMIEETMSFIQSFCPEVNTVGVISTFGTWKTAFYPDVLSKFGFKVQTLNKEQQIHLHDHALFHPEYGIKAQAFPVRNEARNVLMNSIELLKKKGAQAVILGCTEIPLGIPERKLGNIFCIDPGLILARALIREVDENKLLPWSWEK